ncbi:polyhydroxyalkanoate granule-associated phasin [Noviherbaspirillum aridicola]|uniref:Uncharacterized protein n=1 Tax=Noviherbaspirillum aridicola TaxID=2849687 RepID=A0ABQ4QB18_9BURK|nr:polyhydroxyalkanoate granule-associated phasin [Noviherbaspirillum aridicola]GIZ54005.1 hypothetical protein NCCP691_40190 [Noviherbaspirillum aridicola]
MPSRTPFPVAADPMLGWLRFTLGYAEMLQSSAVVIAHRLGRMAAAGPNPGIRDRREFTRMVQEKPQAAAESLQAMMLRAMTLNVQQGMWMAGQMAMAGAGLMRWWMMPAPFLHAGSARRPGRAVMYGGTHAMERLSRACAGIANGGLKPVRSRATANARRLVYRPAGRRAAKRGAR